MRGRNKSWDTWDEHRLDRKDFRDDHGGGPEELPHKKKAKPKPRKARSDHKHIYVEEVEVFRWLGKSYEIHTWKCAEFNCDKVKKYSSFIPRSNGGSAV